MISIYPACFYENKDGSYTVIFPDLEHLWKIMSPFRKLPS